MRILVLCDDRWHPASIVRDGLAPLESTGYTFDWIENAAHLSPDAMFAYPLIILAKANHVSSSDESPWMTEAIERAFVSYVREGNGLFVIHSGTVGYEKNLVLRGLLGGVFASHPKQCPVTVNVRAGHLLTTGSGSLTLMDEHYFMEFDDLEADVFLTTTSTHGEQPGGWTRTEGEGRVCTLTPAHNLEVWLHPSFQALLQNAIRWCSKK
jgi:type 1 glutamine amidotransferase